MPNAFPMGRMTTCVPDEVLTNPLTSSKDIDINDNNEEIEKENELTWSSQAQITASGVTEHHASTTSGLIWTNTNNDRCFITFNDTPIFFIIVIQVATLQSTMAAWSICYGKLPNEGGQEYGIHVAIDCRCTCNHEEQE
eukprot:57261-Ditylum_brightwellii.AAC.1